MSSEIFHIDLSYDSNFQDINSIDEQENDILCFRC
jgi:hypothetical protein